MQGRDLGHVCREGMGQPGTGISLPGALGCLELCWPLGSRMAYTGPVGTGTSMQRVLGYLEQWWAQGSPHGTYWDSAWPWGCAQQCPEHCLGTGVSSRHLQAAQSSCQAQCQELR